MFKYIHKVCPYLDELRIDLKLNKRIRNYRFKNKIVYPSENTIFSKDKNNNKYWYYFSYTIDKKYLESHSVISNLIYASHYNGALKFALYYRLYRKFDKPTIITKFKNKYWYKNGKLHRDYLPAFIGIYGTKIWYKNGEQIKYICVY